MDKKKLLKLIDMEEGTKLDFKLKLDLNFESGKKELAKDICAIANSNGGRGYIIVGIEDKTKEIIGLEDDCVLSEEQIQQIVASRCDPPIPIALEIIEMDKKNIGVITIYNGRQKPYQVRENGAFYIRRGSTTDIMRKQELVASFEENLSLSVECCAIMNSSIRAIDMELVKRYFKRKGVSLTNENQRFLLETSSIIFVDKNTGLEKCTLGGLLIFSNLNSIYLPHNMIRIINKVNKNCDEVTIIQGNLIEMIDKSEKVITSVLPSKYPCDGVLEAVKNAVLYRDYSEFDRVIEVVITRSSVSVVSPGQLIRKGRKDVVNYSRRNMWLYEKVITLDDKKRFLRTGNGMFRMKKSFKNIGKVLFINSKEEESVKVIFPGIKALKNSGNSVDHIMN